MKALLMAAPTDSAPQGVAISDEQAWRDRPKGIGSPALRFWYHVTVHSFGQTLSFAEAERVGQELLAYDAGQRASVGLDESKGLADPTELTRGRMAMVMSGLEDTPTDRQGRFMG